MSVFIPDPVVKRLPMYYRYLKELEQRNVSSISSGQLADLMGLTASQVRQDVNIVGGAGRQGCGYPVTDLKLHIERLMGIHKTHTMMIVGAGNLGRALLHYKAFEQRGFTIAALFDKYPCEDACIGSLPVKHIAELEDFLEQQPVDIAILTLPAPDAQEMALRLYRGGIRGFWNFAPMDIQLPRDAVVVNVHLDESLEMLSYYLESRM